MNETADARAELKIRRIKNGWLLKGRDGWDAFNDIRALLAAVEHALLRPPDESDSQEKFFHPRWPGPKRP